MSQTKKTYLYIGSILIVSLIFFYWHPGGNAIQFLAGIPLVGSLCAILFQILRDQAAHDRALLVQDAQNRFSLGSSSHMANIAFDKLVQFSEEYAEEVHETLTTLFREGPTEQVLKHAGNLYKLQQKYAVWLTVKIEEGLKKFESALKTIGANATYVYGTSGGAGNQQILNSMYQTFAEVMGLEEWQGEKLTDDVAIFMLIRQLRKILGTEELTKLRDSIISKAIK